MCRPDTTAATNQPEGKDRFTLLDRIFFHNSLNLEVKDPHGYPEAVDHPAAIAHRAEQSACVCLT